MSFQSKRGYVLTTATEEKAITGKTNGSFEKENERVALSFYRWQKCLANVLFFSSISIGSLQDIQKILLKECPEKAEYLRFNDYR